MDRSLLPTELKHIKDVGEQDYGPETSVLTHSGFSLNVPAYPLVCDYVRVLDPLGREVAYWVSDEWQESPADVMGAIIGAVARGKSPSSPTPKPEPLTPRVFSVLDIPFERLSGCIIRDIGFNEVIYFEENSHLLEGKDLDADLSLPIFTACGLDEGSVVTEDVSAEMLLALQWNAQEQMFQDADGCVWKFFVNQDVTKQPVTGSSPLASAAPQLLAALKRLMAAPAVNLDSDEPEDREALDAAIEAIQRAEELCSCPACGHTMPLLEWERQPRIGGPGDDWAKCPACGVAEGWHVLAGGHSI